MNETVNLIWMNSTPMDDYSWNSSYVCAVDNESGWGERYFFTYFTQLDDTHNNRVAVEVALFAVIFFLAVVSNGSLVACVVRYPDMRSVTNCLVSNMALADLLLIFTAPAVAYARVTTSWNLGDFVCKLVPYVQFVSGIVLLWTLTLISLDRHYCIVVPPYRSTITPRQTGVFSIIIWLFSSILFIPVFLWFREINIDDSRKVCTLVFPMSPNIHFSACFVMPVVIFACILPMILLVYFYQRIFHKLISTKNTWASSCVMVSTMETKGCSRQGRRQSELSMSDIFVPWPRRMSTPMATFPNGRQGSLSQHEEIRLNKHIRVVRVLFLNVILVLVLWLPITIIMILIFVDGSRPTHDTHFFLRSNHFIDALIIAFFNTLVNPLVYGLLSDNFRACLIRMWCWRRDQQVAKDVIVPSSSRNTTRTSRKQSFEVSEN